jgi:hypothetical protein
MVSLWATNCFLEILLVSGCRPPLSSLHQTQTSLFRGLAFRQNCWQSWHLLFDVGCQSPMLGVGRAKNSRAPMMALQVVEHQCSWSWKLWSPDVGPGCSSCLRFFLSCKTRGYARHVEMDMGRMFPPSWDKTRPTLLAFCFNVYIASMLFLLAKFLWPKANFLSPCARSVHTINASTEGYRASK